MSRRTLESSEVVELLVQNLRRKVGVFPSCVSLLDVFGSPDGTFEVLERSKVSLSLPILRFLPYPNDGDLVRVLSGAVTELPLPGSETK